MKPTERKFTDEEIEKALECCSSYDCDGCPLYSPTINCVILLPQKALELVKRQSEQIEALKEEVNRLSFWNHMRRTAVIDEFADRLCEGRASNDPVVIAAKCLLKEMTEEIK
ncbi:MAG: hypothetical protein J6S23_04020 [Clostridia bacterium]|nr:hypothetical protein [Clostridia bacterium]